MYFSYDENRSIHVPAPFNRVMTPYMTLDTAQGDIPFSIHMTEWQPGAQVDEHAHESAVEAMYCLSGSGVASVGEKEYPLTQNTMIAALAGEKHCIRNTGDTLLRVLCIFSPPVSGESLRSRAQEAVAQYEKERGQSR